MAWSPLAQGTLFDPKTEKEIRVNKCLAEISQELGNQPLDKIVYSWLLKHPALIIPIVGSRKINRIKNAVESIDLNLNSEQWFRIYNASIGKELP